MRNIIIILLSLASSSAGAQTVPDFSFEQDVCEPMRVRFSRSGSGGAAFQWDFGDGNTLQMNNAPSHVFEEEGIYKVVLEVTDAGGNTYSVSKLVPVFVYREKLIEGNDTILCSTQDLPVAATEALAYCWSPSVHFTRPDAVNTRLMAGAPSGWYYLNVLAPGSNRVVNGDFSRGNTGFSSGYQHSPASGVSEGVYAVRNNQFPWHPSFANCDDHTPDNNGNMLLLNGSLVEGQAVWSQQITVQPNTNYAFATWVQSLISSNPAALQFSINGNQIGEIFRASSQTCNWQQFYTVWNSGNTTSATISIVNMNLGQGGNDFALDDISFAEIRLVRDSIFVDRHESPELNFSSEITACKTVSLNAASLNDVEISDWSWSMGNGQAASGAQTEFQYSQAGTYRIRLTGAYAEGCTDTISTVVQLYTARAEILLSDTTVCAGTELLIEGNSNGDDFEWTNSQGSRFSEAAITATINASTRFKLEVRNEQYCTDTASVLASVYTKPVFRKPPDVSVCRDSSIRLNGFNGEKYVYAWSPAADFSDASSVDPVVKPSASTRYTVSITDPTCGDVSDFAVLATVNENPVVTAFSSNEIDCQTRFTFLRAEGATDYEWSPATQTDHPLSANTRAVARATTMFQVKGTNAFGCTAFDSVEVVVTASNYPDYPMPNAFTPNGDGHNDCFGLKHWGQTDALDFSIFNRWGEKVFQSGNQNDCWDGTYRGKPQPQGDYVYFIRTTTFCGAFTRKGLVTLVR